MAAYLIGSISFGYLAGRILRGIDLREHGSRNLGATNVRRILGNGPGIAVLALDIGKGTLAVTLAHWLGGEGLAEILAGAAVISGHIFTVFHGFRGGKGIATGLGVFLYLTPIPILISFGVWLAAFLWTKYISLGSILAAAALPAAILSQKYVFHQEVSGLMIGLVFLISGLVIIKHRANIHRLIAGTEPKFQKQT